MSDAAFQSIREIFDHAALLSGAERTSYLDRACGDDQDLRREVESLLSHHDSTGGVILDKPIMDTISLPRGPADTRDWLEVPERIEGYRIIELLGTGGMGAVYLAEQENPRRRVAIKLLRPGIASPSLLSRFTRESEILGRLRHPGIARIIESGSFRSMAGRGVQPYFAMEYIDGIPIYSYAQRHDLPTGDCLELIAKVCEAIDHAHQNGVTHRDLKPGNILVESDGQPRILDFGIAALTDSDVQVTTVQTDVGQLLGTLPYMSPEQVQGDVRRIEPRTDIYAIGVLAYELLAGHRPYNLANRSLPEASRIICEEEPATLSRVSRSFRGDIETIIGKALEKDPARRYATAAEMAADLRRYLSNQPIRARPPSAAYQLAKFTRRNRAIVGGVAATFITLLLGIILTSWYAVQLSDAREAERLRAEEAASAAETSAAINRFLNQMLSSANPNKTLGREVSVRDLLVDTARQLEQGDLSDQPEVRAAVLITIGDTFLALGDFDQARLHLEAACDLAADAHGTETLPYAGAIESLARLEATMNNYDTAESLFEEARAIRLSHGPHAIEETVGWPSTLPMVYYYTGRYDEALEGYEDAARICRERDPVDRRHLASALSGIALCQEALGRYDKAIDSHHECLALYLDIFGEMHADTSNAYNNLANALEAAGRYQEAEEAHRAAIEIREEMLDPMHPALITSYSNLGLVLSRLERYKDAEVLMRRALEGRRATLPPIHSSTAATLSNLGNCLIEMGRVSEGYGYLTEAHDIALQAVGADHPMAPVILGHMGRAASLLGRFGEAEAKLLESHERLVALLGAEHRRVRRLEVYLHEHYERSGDPDAASRWPEAE